MMNKFFTLFKQDIHHFISNPTILSVFLIFPTIFILLMGFLFEDIYQTDFISSYDFYGVTMVIFIAMMGATLPANLFLEKDIKNSNTRIFYSPVPRSYIYGSKILSCFLFMGLSLVLNIIVFEVTSFVNFGGQHVGYIILLIMNFVLFLTLLSSAICVTLHSEEMTNVILSNSTAVLGFLSGIFFPIATLGEVFENIASYSPLKWTIDCVFQLIYDGQCSYYWWIMLGIFVLSMFLLLVVHKNYRPEDYI